MLKFSQRGFIKSRTIKALKMNVQMTAKSFETDRKVTSEIKKHLIQTI